jgi:hypothetical protein
VDSFELKLGRNTYTITDEDRIMFNGNRYQLVTQNYQSQLNYYTQVLSKAKAEKYIKQGYLVEHLRTNKFGMLLIYYKFVGNPES